MDDFNDENDELYLTEDEINGITSAAQGYDMLFDRDLLIDYVDNIDDIKNILMLKYHSNKYNKIENSKKTDLYENYPTFMQKLGLILKHLKEYIKLPEFQKELGEIYKISESHMEKRVCDLEKMIDNKEFPILTAGEAKAGKSTFINLLLGTDLMPMDVITCTRMMCEIRKSKEKSVTFITEEKSEKSAAKSEEKSVKKKSIVKNFSESEEISKIIRKQEHKEFTKAIFKYPVQFLENFTYLVDSPGIGDTFHLEKMTYEFVRNYAPAFIFVLNATNSNGLNIKARELIENSKKELENETNKYITDISNKSLKEYYLQYHKAIFILNHWDVVKGNAKSDTEVEEVRNIIIKEIKMLWHESVKENEQIFFISARQANEWQKRGYLQKEIITIRHCIRKLVVNLYQKNLENSFELLNIILNNLEKKILQKINTTVDNKYCKIYDKKNAELLCKALENLTKEMENRKIKIKEKLKPKFEDMAIRLTEHLKSETIENRILEKSQESLTHSDNMDLLKVVFRKLLETRLYDEIKLWEEETNQMEQLYSFLNNLFEQNLIEISNEIKITNSLVNKESLIKAWNSTNQCEITNFDKDFISKIEKVFIISTITLLFPVVALAGILATPLIMNHLIKERRTNEQQLKEYNDDRQKYLRRMIHSNLQKLGVDDVKRSFFINVQKKCEEHIKAFETFITIEINEKKQLITDIEKENREIPEILESLSKLFYKVEDCYGEYNNLKVQCDRVHDMWTILKRPSFYDKLSKSNSKITQSIATGKHSLIFKNENYPNVVFKTYSKRFHLSNARFQMQEIDLLITAPAEFILRCKHICMMDNDSVMLVLDDVDCNLQQYLNENPELVPGKQEKDTDLWRKACMFILNVSFQLCKGLNYLHFYEPRMVHPDLRLDTILVKKTHIPEKIKIYICDACSNLPTQRSQRKSGTDMKQPPEDSFDMGGYTKENIFRLGAIFYKLAHFEKDKVNPDIKNSFVSIKKLFNEINVSMESTESEHKIDWDEKRHNNLPTKFIELIKKCNSLKPEDRPNITECIDILKEIEEEMNSSYP